MFWPRSRLSQVKSIDPGSKCLPRFHNKILVLVRGFMEGRYGRAGGRDGRCGGRRVAGVAHTIPFFRSCHTRLRIEPGFIPGPAWAVRRNESVHADNRGRGSL